MRATMDAVSQLLHYAATHQDAEITFHRSNVVSKICTYALYLSKFGARSRVEGHFFFVV